MGSVKGIVKVKFLDGNKEPQSKSYSFISEFFFPKGVILKNFGRLDKQNINHSYNNSAIICEWEEFGYYDVPYLHNGVQLYEIAVKETEHPSIDYFPINSLLKKEFYCKYNVFLKHNLEVQCKLLNDFTIEMNYSGKVLMELWRSNLDNVVIYCENEEEAEAARKMLHENDFKWSSGHSLLTDGMNFDAPVSYFFEGQDVKHRNGKEFFLKKGYNVYNFSDFEFVFVNDLPKKILKELYKNDLDNIAIYYESKEEATAARQMLHDNGFKWGTGDFLSDGEGGLCHPVFLDTDTNAVHSKKILKELYKDQLQNVAICCKNEVESTAAKQMLHENGFEWSSGHSLLTEGMSFSPPMCYEFGKDGIKNHKKDYFLNKNYTIYNFSDFDFVFVDNKSKFNPHEYEYDNVMFCETSEEALSFERYLRRSGLYSYGSISRMLDTYHNAPMVYNYRNNDSKRIEDLEDLKEYYEWNGFEILYAKDFDFNDETKVEFKTKSLGEWILPMEKIEYIEKSSPHKSVIIDTSNTSIDAIVCHNTIGNRIKPEELGFNLNEKKKESKMNFKNMFKGMNFDFGQISNDQIAYSLKGIAVRDPETNKFYTYSKDGVTDVTDMLFEFPLFAMPVNIKAIAINDIIKHRNEFMLVHNVGSDGVLTVTNMNEAKQEAILPIKNIFGFDFYTKIMAPMGNMFDSVSNEAPFGNMLPFMMMSDENSDMGEMVMAMSLMGGLGANQNAMMNMLPMMMMMNKNGEKKDMMEYFMMMQMMQMFQPVQYPVMPTQNLEEFDVKPYVSPPHLTPGIFNPVTPNQYRNPKVTCDLNNPFMDQFGEDKFVNKPVPEDK